MGYPRRRLDSELDGTITYPTEFIQKLEENFPDWEFLIKAAKEGKECVPWLLDNKAESTQITPKEIMEETSLARLKDKARVILLCRELAAEGRKIIHEQ